MCRVFMTFFLIKFKSTWMQDCVLVTQKLTHKNCRQSTQVKMKSAQAPVGVAKTALFVQLIQLQNTTMTQSKFAINELRVKYCIIKTVS